MVVPSMKTGSLREQVLWIVRDIGPCGLADVCGVLRQDREISMNAVQTVLNRLADQGIIVKSGARRHYVYEVRPSEDVLRERAAQAAVDLLSQSGDLGLAHFVDTIERIKPDTIQKLEQLLTERRAKLRLDDDEG
jgi:predicted transcriptional regulator